MPRRMQVEFSAVVQRQTDASETEMTGDALWDLFQATYLRAPPRRHRLPRPPAGRGQTGHRAGRDHRRRARPCAARATAPSPPRWMRWACRCAFIITKERATGSGANAQALAIVEAAMDGVAGATFGAGASHNIVTASVRKAIVSAANRLASKR